MPYRGTRGPPKRAPQQTISQMQKSYPIQTGLMKAAEPVDRAVRAAGSGMVNGVAKGLKTGGELMDSIVNKANSMMGGKKAAPGKTYLRGRQVPSRMRGGQRGR